MINEKGFKNTTVNDISDNAMINRSTFYLHYTDKYDLLAKTVNEAIDNILQSIEPEKHIVNGKPDYDMFLNNLCYILKVVEKNAKLYSIILNDKESLGISRMFEYALKKKLDECFPMQLSISRELCLELAPAIYSATIRWWLNNGMKYSSAFLANELVKFFEYGTNNILNDLNESQ
jgi:Transcriptional regulator